MRCQPTLLGQARSARCSACLWRSRTSASPVNGLAADVRSLRVAATKPRRLARLAVVPAAANAASAADASFSEESSSGRALPSLPSRAQRLLHSRHDKDILNLAVPALFSLMLDPIMSMTDTAFVGRLGSAQLAAVGGSSIIFVFASVLFNFLLFITVPQVAAAVAQGDKPKASAATAQGLWVALFAGMAVALSLWFSAPMLASKVLGAGPEVVLHAVAYLRCRAVACPALLGMYVITGSFRGHKDTRSPLFAAVLSNIVNFGLDIFLMFGLGWGVAGAALATSASQYVSFGLLYARMLSKGMLFPEDMRRLPPWETVKPFLLSGMALSMRSVILMGMYVFATSIIASIGATTLAASEIVRQVFVLSLQSFSALDVSSQALVATYLGKGNRQMARDVLIRVLQLGFGVGMLIGAAILLTRNALPLLFTNDPAVQAIAASTLPVLGVLMPLDAVGSVMDGGLLGASETSWVARASIINALICICGLLLTRWLLPTSLFWMWAAMKLMSVCRVVTCSIRYSSPDCKLSAAAAAASA